MPTSTWFVWSSRQPAQTQPLVDAVPELFDALGVRPTRITLIESGKPGEPRHETYSRAKLATLDRDRPMAALWVSGAPSQPWSEVSFDLRAHPGFERVTQAWHAIVRTCVGAEAGAVAGMRLLEVAAHEYPVVHGGAAMLPSRWHSSAEANLTLHGSVTADVEPRVHFDAMHLHESLRLARRLYPVTIFGPELWSQLPPLPAVEPALTVEDVGTCKLLRCWPELCDPHDPQFLLGTRELRRWLWPYTIQNPADDPDEVDRKLRWAGLRPG